MWAAIISAILSAALPLLESLLQSWLAQALHVAAADTPVSVGATGPTKDTQLALLAKVRAGLWFFQLAKKQAVDAVAAKIKIS